MTSSSKIPRVSVVIPAYQAAPFIDDCLDSVLNQGYRDFEVIVVNDGSRDNTSDLVLKRNDARIRLVESANMGASCARNTGLKYARGNYIQFLDADDCLESTKLSEHVIAHTGLDKFALSLSLVSIFSQRCFFDGAGMNEFVVDANNPRQWLLGLYGVGGKGGMIQTGQWFAPRTLLDRIGPWNENLSFDDDGEYFARAVFYSSRLRGIHSTRCYYRRDPNRASLGKPKVWTEKDNLSRARAAIARANIALQCGPRRKAVLAASKIVAPVFLDTYKTSGRAYDECKRWAQEVPGFDITRGFTSSFGRCVARLAGWRLARRLRTQKSLVRGKFLE